MKQLFFLSCFLCGCGLIGRPVSPPPPVSPAPSESPQSSSPQPPAASLEQHYPLLAPQTYGRAYIAQTLLEGHRLEQDFKLHFYLEIDSQQILIIGFTPWQTRAFSLQYDGTQLDFKNFTDRELPFPPALILSDLQLVLWSHLPQQGEWRVVEDDQTHERRVYYRQQLVSRITYHGEFPVQGKAELSNTLFDYHLHIRTLHSQSSQATVQP